MTAIEDRLRAVLAEQAGAVREDTLRPLAGPAGGQRRWARIAAPAAAAAAVLLVLGTEIIVGQHTSPPRPAAGKPSAAPVTVQVSTGYLQGMAYSQANSTLYTTVFPRHDHNRSERGILAMINTATCNGSDARGCHHATLVDTSGYGALDVVVNDQTHTVYVLNNSSSTLAVINANTCNATTIRDCRAALVPLPSVGAPVAGIPADYLAINPRTDTVYVIGFQAELSVINGSTCNASDTSGCGTPPVSYSLSGATRRLWGMSVDQNTNTVYLSADGRLLLINGRTCDAASTSGCTKVLATIPSISEWNMTVDPADSTIYSPSPSREAVLAINSRACDALSTGGCRATAKMIRGGPYPRYVAADPETGTIYVSGADSVTTVRAASCNAASVAACAEFPTAFPVGTDPTAMLDATPVHTLYVINWSAGSVSVINSATCNVSDIRGCPAHSPPGTPPIPTTGCGYSEGDYETGAPAGPMMRVTTRVAAGSADGLEWSVWAPGRTPGPAGIEQGGIVLNGKWYTLCSQFQRGHQVLIALIDTGGRGVIYGLVPHAGAMRLRAGVTGPQWTPTSARLPGATFFILRLPRSACAYRSLGVHATQRSAWHGAYQDRQYRGGCSPGHLVNSVTGEGDWGVTTTPTGQSW